MLRKRQRSSEGGKPYSKILKKDFHESDSDDRNDPGNILSSTLNNDIDLSMDDSYEESVIEESDIEESDIEVSDNIKNSISYVDSDARYNSFNNFLRSINFEEEEENINDEIAGEKTYSSQKKLQKIETSISDDACFNPPVSSEIEHYSKNHKIVQIPSQHIEILILNHPSSVTLHGCLKIRVVSGVASIHGRKILPDHEETVFSFKTPGFFQICSLDSDFCNKKKVVRKKLRKILLNEEDINDVIYHCLPTSTVVVVEKQLYPFHLQFLSLYYPNVLPNGDILHHTIENRRYYSYNKLCSNNDKHAIKLSLKNQEILSNVTQEIIASFISGNGLSVMVYGGSKMGKSTFLRYLINLVLGKCKTVYYLDADPGQTEFALPGVVSLTELEKPLLGAPYTHQHTPLAMIFTGSISPDSSPNMYAESVKKLFDLHQSKHPQSILFINTMGWIQGLGAECNKDVRNVVQPDIIIEFTTPKEDSILKQTMNKKVKHFQVERNPTRCPQSYGSQMRNYKITSYFGKCLNSYMRPIYLNALRPFQVKWENIAIYVMNRTLPPQRLIEAVHGSIVALCKVKDSDIVHYEDKELPKTLSHDVHNSCIGFGLVRSVDEINNILYVISPLHLEDMKNVNAIIKGNVTVPEEFILKQPLTNITLPFTGIGGKKIFRKKTDSRLLDKSVDD